MELIHSTAKISKKQKQTSKTTVYIPTEDKSSTQFSFFVGFGGSGDLNSGPHSS
jgi:hypothetical protein